MKKLIFILLLFSLSLQAQVRTYPLYKSGESPIYCTQNLLLYSEVLTDAVYVHDVNITVTASNSETDFIGGLTMETLTSTYGTCFFNQTVTVSASTTYRFSFDVKRGTSTDLKWQIRDMTHYVDIVAPTSYYASTSSTVQRVSIQFTTPAGCTSIKLFPVINIPPGTVYIGRLQLEMNGSCYVTTTSSIITP